MQIVQKLRYKHCKNCVYYKQKGQFMYCTEFGRNYLNMDDIMDSTRIFCFKKKKRGRKVKYKV